MSEREVWIRFMAALLSADEVSVEDAAKWADDSMIEYRRRWPRPEFDPPAAPDERAAIGEETER